MKLRIIYNLFFLALLAFVFQSRSGGPAMQAGLRVTGAPNEGTCANAGCHVTGAFDASMTIELLEGVNVVTEYEPGKSYTLRLAATAGTGTPSVFGFQAVSLDGSELQAGAWENLGADNHTINLAGNSYAEHSTPSADGTIEIGWVAPAENTGDVTIYASMLLANGNGNFQGDGGTNSSLSLTEKDVSNTFSISRDYANLSVYPNPVQNELNLEITSRNTGNYSLRFLDVSGQIVRNEQIFINSGNNKKVFEVSELNKGFYIIQLCGEQHIASTEMLKM